MFRTIRSHRSHHPELRVARLHLHCFRNISAHIAFLPIEIWMRGYLAIGILMIVQSCITLAKTQRDAAENARLDNRVETARTEKILMGS